jgi:hypothetical protein
MPRTHFVDRHDARWRAVRRTGADRLRRSQNAFTRRTSHPPRPELISRGIDGFPAFAADVYVFDPRRPGSR